MKAEEAIGRLQNATWGSLFGAKDLWGSNGLKDKLTFRQPTRRFLLRAGGGGRAVTHVGLVEQLCHVNGNLCLIAGIGSITTIAEERRKGYATMLMQHVLDVVKKEGRAKCVLAFCFETMMPLFKDWNRVLGKVQVQQPGRQIAIVKSPYAVMSYRLTEPSLVREVWLESYPW